MEYFAQILLLMGMAVTIVVTFHRLHIPSSLGYLLVGLLLGPHTMGPVINVPHMQTLAEFGIVFLLFTIGLSFSLPQIYALRHQVLGLGTAQVLFTTIVIGLVVWLVGVPPAAAFVVGAVFAQSSTSIIGKQLREQGEENSRHGKLGVAMSVFQDVTAVPFIVVIPVLGVAVGAEVLAGTLGWALAKAAVAFALVYFAGRWLLRPVFHFVAERRSAEIFTLTVLFIALLAGWTTSSLGLSLAFGAFLAGMMLGETEFRHQVESTIRPFQDVLLGLFFIGIGMLFDPAVLPQIWHYALLGAVLLLMSKTLLVAFMMWKIGIDSLTAWRTGLLLAVGGEFGFALLAIALNANVIDVYLGQITLIAVLFSMFAGPFIIRYNHVIANYFACKQVEPEYSPTHLTVDSGTAAHLQDHVIICGYGRIGQGIAHFLQAENIPFIALDLSSSRVREAHKAGEPVYYGDATDHGILDALGLARARLIVISYDDVSSALKILDYLKGTRPDLPAMVRTRDESRVQELKSAGAFEVVPETLEAGLMIASQALLLLNVPQSRVIRRIQEQRSAKYSLMQEFFPDDAQNGQEPSDIKNRLRVLIIPPTSRIIGLTIQELNLNEVMVIALVRSHEHMPSPSPETTLAAHDEIVLYGTADDLQRAEQQIHDPVKK
ncbi:MAG: cation:proton antiporter [Nitrosomonas sp.]|nr:cation:proton antiporter [Nitrosomonas sp.]MCW5608234.1 cation:proton antiporter [Nitrosomonas sp.]